MNLKERENVAILERRIAHLDSRARGVAGKHWDRQEARALRWALKVVAEAKALQPAAESR